MGSVARGYPCPETQAYPSLSEFPGPESRIPRSPRSKAPTPRKPTGARALWRPRLPRAPPPSDAASPWSLARQSTSLPALRGAAASRWPGGRLQESSKSGPRSLGVSAGARSRSRRCRRRRLGIRERLAWRQAQIAVSGNFVSFPERPIERPVGVETQAKEKVLA